MAHAPKAIGDMCKSDFPSCTLFIVQYNQKLLSVDDSIFSGAYFATQKARGTYKIVHCVSHFKINKTMKKILLTLFLLFSLMTMTNAQDIGVSLGTNFSNVAGDGVINPDSKFNFTLGLFAEFMIADNLGLQPELVLSGQGYKFIDDDGTGTDFEWKQKLSYLNVPVLLNYYIVDNFYLQAGPYLGVLRGADLNISGSLGILGGNNKDGFESTDFGFIVGAGFKMDKTSIGFRYQLGASDIVPNSDIQNRVFNVALGYRFLQQ